MALRLKTMAEVNAVRRAVPKGAGKSRLTENREKATDERKAAAKFRAAVWTRDGSTCRLCGRAVRKTLTLCPEQGHVHHVRGRNVAPEDRFNPKAALLLCCDCHQKHHAGTVKVKP